MSSRTLPPNGPSRRNFLKGAAAAAPLASCASIGASASGPKLEGPIKVGLIGCGGRGRGAAYQALNADEGVVLYALADAFPDKVASAKESLEIRLMEDDEELGVERPGRLDLPEERCFSGLEAFEALLATDVDVVILATPPGFRPQHLAATIAAGKHVFTEKPLAVDAPGVRSVLETARLAKERELNLVSGFCWRYNVRHRAFMERIHAGAIGDLEVFYSTYNTSPLGKHPRKDGWSDLEWQIRNWQHFLWLGGDHVVEQAVHSLDKQAWAFQDAAPLACTAVGGRQARQGAESGNIYDHFGLTYDYPNGAKAFHQCRQIANCSNENRDYLWGTNGRAIIENWTPRHEIFGDVPWVYEGEGNDMYQQEHDELFAALRSGRLLNDGEWAARSTLLAIMARMAAYTGKTVTWDEAMSSEDALVPDQLAWGPIAARPIPVPGQTPFV